jgi:hypothetical protein
MKTNKAKPTFTGQSPRYNPVTTEWHSEGIKGRETIAISETIIIKRGPNGNLTINGYKGKTVMEGIEILS